MEKNETLPDDEIKEDIEDFSELDEYDFPGFDTKDGKKFFYEYATKTTNLQQIFNHYGTEAKPKVKPADDPPAPEKKEKKEAPSPIPKKTTDSPKIGNEGLDGEDISDIITPVK